MPRFIDTSLHPQSKAAQLVGDRPLTITPSHLASRAISARHQPLCNFAIKALKQQGLLKAQPLQAQTIFRQMVQSVLRPADLIGTARALMPVVRSLLQSSPSLECDLDNLSARAVSFVTLAQRYQAALRENRCFDPVELYWRATELTVEPERLLIYGYFQPEPGELAWLNKFAAPESIFFLPTAATPLFADIQAAVDLLEQSGWSVLSDDISPSATGVELCQSFLSIEPPAQPDAVNTYAYGTFEAEARSTLAQVKALLNADVPAKEIAIIARDERAYGPKLIDIAWEYGVPLRVLYSTPLLTTRLGGWIALLLSVLDANFPFEATAKLLSHPLCSNPDSGFWAIARAQHPSGIRHWSEIAREHLDRDLTGLGQVNQSRRRDTWVDWWQQLFQSFDLRRRCARWARESIAFNTLQTGLVNLSKPEGETLSWVQFRQKLEDLLESLTVPAQPGRGGIELHSPASVVGAQYSHLFIVGMAEGILPPPVSNDAALDFFERQRLGDQGIVLPTAIALFRQEAIAFYHLLQAATGQVVFSYPQMSDRTEQLPSAYLKRMGLQVSAPPKLPIASFEEMRRYYLRQPATQMATQIGEADPVLAEAIRAFHVEQHRESAQRANEYDGIIGIPFDYRNWAFSASQLTSLGQCPFKWFASKVLKLGAPAEIEEDLSPSLRGSLYHKVVELLVQAVQADSTLKLTDANLLREKFIEAEQAVQLSDLLNWKVRREEHIRQLSATLKKPTFWPSEADPIDLEKRFEGEWQGLKITGRIDRIDETPDGLVLIDYKTGGSAPKGIKAANGKASIDLQLPLYQAIAADLYPDKRVVEAQYYSLTKGKKLSVSGKAPQHELPAAIESCKTALATGNYPVQPDHKQDACTYCDFDLICRRGNRLARKEKL